MFRNWFGFLFHAAEDWLDQAASAVGELGEAVPERRETDKALYTSLAMACKNNVVKTVTHKRGFESWRKLCKKYGSATGTSLHEYTNLLEYDFGTTDGFKKRLLKWENQIVDFQKATGEVFSDRLKCAIVLSRSPGPIRTYLRFQNRGDYGALRMALMNYLEAEDDTNGPVPMEVGAMKISGKKGDKGKKGYGKGKYGKNFGKYDESNEYSKNNEYGKGYEKGKDKGKKGTSKGQGKDERPATNSSFQGYCRSCGKWGHKARRVLARLRSRSGGSSEFFREFSGAECSDHTCGCERRQRLFKKSMMRMNRLDLRHGRWIRQRWGQCVGQWVGVNGMSICMVWCSDISVNDKEKA